MLVTLNKQQNIDNILLMRAQHKRHYITLIKRNKPCIHADVEAFNTQFCNISSNSQKYYNYCFNITCLPTCSITGKILEFRSDKWHYRKYGERGVMSRDSILERSKKHVGITFTKKFTDIANLECVSITFDDLYRQINDIAESDNLSAISHRLKYKFPMLKKQLIDFYNASFLSR